MDSHLVLCLGLNYLSPTIVDVHEVVREIRVCLIFDVSSLVVINNGFLCSSQCSTECDLDSHRLHSYNSLLGSTEHAQWQHSFLQGDSVFAGWRIQDWCPSDQHQCGVTRTTTLYQLLCECVGHYCGGRSIQWPGDSADSARWYA